MDLALNNLQWLMCPKTKPNQTHFLCPSNFDQESGIYLTSDNTGLDTKSFYSSGWDGHTHCWTMLVVGSQDTMCTMLNFAKSLGTYTKLT